MNRFFEPQSIAVIGASKNRSKGGYRILENLIEWGYTGRIYPVNPQADEILGLKVFPSVSSLPEIPDLAVLVVPREMVLDVVERAGKFGIDRMIIVANRFSDGDAEGQKLEESLVELTESMGIRVLGPNSIGVVNTKIGLVTSILPLEVYKRGGVSFIGQTGMFLGGFARWITSSQYFGIDKVAILGNKCDLDEADMIEYFGSEKSCNVIALYLEGVKDGRKFLKKAANVAGKKPLLILKSGRTRIGARATASHTGSMSGEDRVFDAAMKQVHAIRVYDFDELFDLAKALSYFADLPSVKGERVGVVSVSGAGCVLSADAISDCGLMLSDLSEDTIKRVISTYPPGWRVQNPIDMWSAIEEVGADEAYLKITQAVMEDPEVDGVSIIFMVIPTVTEMDIRRFVQAIKVYEKPFVICFMGGDMRVVDDWERIIEEEKVPVYHSPERAIRAIGTVLRWKNGKV
ncbi:MAG: acetate--CoA ligase family protein [Candidatus Syntropharchaeales archaeon]